MKATTKILIFLIFALLLCGGIFLQMKSDSPVLHPRSDGRDRTAEIEEKLEKYGYCELEKGEYHISSHLWMPDGTTLRGIGCASRLVWDDGDYSGVCITVGSDCAVSDLAFEGPFSECPTEYNNLTAFAVGDGRADFSLSNVFVRGFMTGFLSLDNGCNSSNGGRFANCVFENCYYGVNFGKFGEYNRVTNCQMNCCYMGAKVTGGNNSFVNCSFDHNYIGAKIGGGENSGHGSMIGCSFNHAKASCGAGYSIWAENYSNGFVISGCQIFFGKLRIKSVEGMTVDACNFGRGDFSNSETGIAVEIDNSAVVFTGNLFSLPPRVDKTDMGIITQSGNILISDGSEVLI